MELGAHFRARVWIECGHRLVEQQHARLTRECAGECDALALATRERVRTLVRQVRDPQTVEQSVGVAAAEGDVLRHREVRKERVLLEDIADGALLGAKVDLPVEPHVVSARNPASRGLHEARHRTQHRGLTRAGGPDERDRLAPDVEAQLDVEAAGRNGEIEPKRIHPATFSPMRMPAPTRTKSALIASATSKF